MAWLVGVVIGMTWEARLKFYPSAAVPVLAILAATGVLAMASIAGMDSVASAQTVAPDASADGSTQAPADATRPEPLLNLNIRRTQLTLNRGAIHEWDRYVRGFRRDHNFALVSGIGVGVWQVNSFGSLTSERFPSDTIFTRFQYSFHLPIWRGFGYVLGSGMGYVHESSARDSVFQTVPAVQLPGILAGFVWNFSPALRLGTSLEAYLERLNGLKERDGTARDPRVHITMETWDLSTWFDGFYALDWAFRVETHWRQSAFKRPRSPEGKAVDANIRRTDRWVAAGLVYHLL